MVNVRISTCRLIDLAENGMISWENLTRNLLTWMSEEDVAAFANSEGYFEGYFDEEDEETDS